MAIVTTATVLDSARAAARATALGEKSWRPSEASITSHGSNGWTSKRRRWNGTVYAEPPAPASTATSGLPPAALSSIVRHQ